MAITVKDGTGATASLRSTANGGDQVPSHVMAGGVKGASPIADITSTAEGTDHQALDVQIMHGGAAKDPTQIRALTSGDVVTPAATEAHLGSVGGASAQANFGLVVSTSPYVAGYCVGGLITLTNVLRTGGPGTGVLQSLLVADQDNQKAAFDILFFNANPAGSTFTDHAAAVIAAADVPKLIRKVSVAATDYATIASRAVADKSGLGGLVSAASGTTLYAVIITSGTPTYTATSSLTVRCGLLLD